MSNVTRPGRATIAAVAKASGVSPSTVDRVLNGRAGVRLDTAKRIEEAAAQLGFYGASVIRERVRGKQAKFRLGFLVEPPESAFHRQLADTLQGAAKANADRCDVPVVEFMQDISPLAVSKQLRRLGESVDAVAIVSADHPLLTAEIARLQERGVPVFALISALSAPAHAGYVGLDNRSVGRTAAWFITNMAKQAGKLVVFVGSHRFQCQELAEMSFRSYVREHAPAFELMEPFFTLESNSLAEEGARELLQQHPDIVGMFIAGGGAEGVLTALAENQAAEAERVRPICITRELTQVMRDGLSVGHLHAVLSHPLPQLSHDLFDMMLGVLDKRLVGLQNAVVPLEIHTPQNV